MPQIAKPVEPMMPLFNGSTTEITLPSGRVVKIRETNGDDDEVLSSMNTSSDGSNFYNFLASITLNDSFINKKPSANDIKHWPINDKYGLIFKQRLFIHGKELNFRATCTEENCKHEATYHEDLSQWDNDLTQEEKEDIPSIALHRYPNGNQQELEFTISSGKKLKYSILNGILEKRALELKDATKNSPIIIRNLHIFNKGEWIPVKHFAGFSSKEMIEIRRHIKTNDRQFDPIVTFACNNPLCRKEYSVSLFSIGDFFYPEEMI